MTGKLLQSFKWSQGGSNQVKLKRTKALELSVSPLLLIVLIPLTVCRLWTDQHAVPTRKASPLTQRFQPRRSAPRNFAAMSRGSGMVIPLRTIVFLVVVYGG